MIFLVFVIILLMILVLIFTIYFILFDEFMMAYSQRRSGPLNIGFYGLLSPFINACNLFIAQIQFPKSHSYSYSFQLISFPSMFLLISFLSSFLIFPYYIIDVILSLFIFLILSSLFIIAVIYSSFSSLSKYSMLGSLRIASQLISYELILITVIVILISMHDLFSIFEIYDLSFMNKTSWITELWIVDDIFILFLDSFYLSCNANLGFPGSETLYFRILPSILFLARIYSFSLLHGSLLHRRVFSDHCCFEDSFSLYSIYVVGDLRRINKTNSSTRGLSWIICNSCPEFSEISSFSFFFSLFLVLFLLVLFYSSLAFINLFSFSLFFIISFISILAESNRVPFDLPEAESELVAGFQTDFSSIFFSFIILSEYVNLITMSFLFIILFNLNPYFILFYIFMSCITRSLFPRYRFDQLMSLLWSSFLPALFSFFLVSFILIFNISYSYSLAFFAFGALITLLFFAFGVLLIIMKAS